MFPNVSLQLQLTCMRGFDNCEMRGNAKCEYCHLLLLKNIVTDNMGMISKQQLAVLKVYQHIARFLNWRLGMRLASSMTKSPLIPKTPNLSRVGFLF